MRESEPETFTTRKRESKSLEEEDHYGNPDPLYISSCGRRSTTKTTMKNSPAAQRCLRRGLERPSPRFLLLFFTIQYTALKGNYSSSWIPVRFTSFYWTTTTLFYKNALMVQPPLSLFGSLLVLSRMCGRESGHYV